MFRALQRSRAALSAFPITARASSLQRLTMSSAAAPSPAPSGATIFDKILSKEIPSKVVYEDEQCYAFRDISPCAPTHILVIPKVKGRLSQLQHATEEDKGVLGHLLWAVSHIAKSEGLAPGYRVVINDGQQGAQTVYHLHLHIIGGKQLGWPPTGVP